MLWTVVETWTQVWVWLEIIKKSVESGEPAVRVQCIHSVLCCHVYWRSYIYSVLKPPQTTLFLFVVLSAGDMRVMMVWLMRMVKTVPLESWLDDPSGLMYEISGLLVPLILHPHVGFMEYWSSWTQLLSEGLSEYPGLLTLPANCDLWPSVVLGSAVSDILCFARDERGATVIRCLPKLWRLLNWSGYYHFILSTSGDNHLGSWRWLFSWPRTKIIFINPLIFCTCHINSYYETWEALNSLSYDLWFNEWKYFLRSSPQKLFDVKNLEKSPSGGCSRPPPLIRDSGSKVYKSMVTLSQSSTTSFYSTSLLHPGVGSQYCSERCILVMMVTICWPLTLISWRRRLGW